MVFSSSARPYFTPDSVLPNPNLSIILNLAALHLSLIQCLDVREKLGNNPKNYLRNNGRINARQWKTLLLRFAFDDPPLLLHAA